MKKLFIVLISISLNLFSQVKEETKVENPNKDLIAQHSLDGATYFEDGAYKSAIIEYDKVLNLKPENEYVYYYSKALAYIKLEDYKEALGNLNKAIRLNSEYSNAYLQRGYLYQHYFFEGEGLLEKAKADYDKCIELSPNNAKAYNLRGIVNGSKEKYTAAIIDFNSAIKIDPEAGEYFLNRAATRYMIGDTKGACDDCSKAVGLGYQKAVDELKNYCNQN